jgi:hypothetical protein
MMMVRAIERVRAIGHTITSFIFLLLFYFLFFFLFIDDLSQSEKDELRNEGSQMRKKMME